MYFPALDNLISRLSTLPGIGRRSARRIAFHLVRSDHSHVEEFAKSLIELKQKVRFCTECGALSENDLCHICSDESRSGDSFCVVEEPGDIYAIEQTGEFEGRYHVLMGALSPLDGIGPEDLRIKELLQRMEAHEVKEIIVATNPTMEGDATARYIHDLIKNSTHTRVTRISHGISTGGSIEYSEQSALARSLRNRTDIE